MGRPPQGNDLAVVGHVQAKSSHHRFELWPTRDATDLARELGMLRHEFGPPRAQRLQGSRRRASHGAPPHDAHGHSQERGQRDSHHGSAAQSYALLRHARRCALRARGLVSISAEPAPTALRVSVSPNGRPRQVHIGWRGGQMQDALQSRNARFTMRSSPEWYAMTRRMPPGVRRSRSAGSAPSSAVSSSFTAMRQPKDRRELRWPASGSEHCADRIHEVIRRLEGMPLTPPNDFTRQAQGVSSAVAVFAENVFQLALIEFVEQLPRVEIDAVIHAHVQRRIGPKRETARFGIELMTRHAQVDQYSLETLSRERGYVIHIREVHLQRAGPPWAAKADSRSLASAMAAESRSSPVTSTPRSSSASGAHRLPACNRGRVRRVAAARRPRVRGLVREKCYATWQEGSPTAST